MDKPLQVVFCRDPLGGLLLIYRSRHIPGSKHSHSHRHPSAIPKHCSPHPPNQTTMLGKGSGPGVGKLTRPLRSGLVDSAKSPRSPLECSMPSPKGLKSYDQGGVGLGIVVALDKSNKNLSISSGGGEIFLAKYAISGQFSTRSSPIPVGSPVKAKANQMRDALDEEFTYVTCHGPNKSVTTRVYYDRGDQYGIITGRNRIELRGGVGSKRGVFKISPARLFDDRCSYGTDSDFLSSCHLCRKALHGKDIYMYRGEKAFCSAECRQRQIAIDERKEHRRSKISRSNDVVSSSPCCTGGQIFSTGIIAV